MNSETLFNNNVKYELNHIYTEKPKSVIGGLDFGWFCREHAFHVYILASLFKRKSRISVGDILLKTPNNVLISTLGTDSDHAWCSVDDKEPVDFSVTIKYLDPDSNDLPIIYGNNLEEIYKFTFLQDTRDELIIARSEHENNCLIYNKKQHFNTSPLTLLKNPFQFLHAPPSGCPSLLDLYGADIFYQITWHCYKLIKGKVNPFYRYRNPDSTFKAIAKFNSNAKQKIIELLQN